MRFGAAALLMGLAYAAGACDGSQEKSTMTTDAALEHFVPGARIGVTYGETKQVLALSPIVPFSSSRPGGPLADSGLGFSRFTLGLGLFAYDQEPDSSEIVEWVELWSASRLVADSASRRVSQLLGVKPSRSCHQFRQEVRYLVEDWATADGGVALERPLRADLNYSRIIFFRGPYDPSKLHRSEGRVACPQ